jgi:hypothetical protein
LQAIATFAISNDRICKALEISLPDRLPGFYHTWGAVGG